MSTNQPRKPAGIPAGGQWAAMTHAESDVDLSPAQPLREISRGCWEVFDTVTEERAPMNGLTRTAFHIGGQPHLRARAGLVAAVYGAKDKERDIEAELKELDGKKVTVLTQGKTGSVLAQEGTISSGADVVALVSKGSQTKGVYLYGHSRSPRLLDYRAGYGHAEELAERFRSVEVSAPELEPAHFDDIPVADGEGEPPSAVAAAFVFDHPGFDGDQDGRGCVFFATDRDPAEVVNGYFVAPPGSGLESERGSFTTEQLSRWGGRVKGFQAGSLTFRDAMELGEKASRWSNDADMGPTWEAIGAGNKSSGPA